MFAIVFKAVLHNVGVVIVGLGVALAGLGLDSALAFGDFRSAAAMAGGVLLIIAGFFVRLWATVEFYKHRMRVISLRPQRTLLTSGAYRVSRNPLYLGGNVFIFFGAALVLGSPGALLITAIHLPLVDAFIRREEVQLDKEFGDQWRGYKRRVRRWI